MSTTTPRRAWIPCTKADFSSQLHRCTSDPAGTATVQVLPEFAFQLSHAPGDCLRGRSMAQREGMHGPAVRDGGCRSAGSPRDGGGRGQMSGGTLLAWACSWHEGGDVSRRPRRGGLRSPPLLTNRCSIAPTLLAWSGPCSGRQVRVRSNVAATRLSSVDGPDCSHLGYIFRVHCVMGVRCSLSGIRWERLACGSRSWCRRWVR